MAKVKTHGGARSNAGRKRIDDKKQTITIYIRQSVIDAHGSPEIVKEKATKYINKIPKSKNNNQAQ